MFHDLIIKSYFLRYNKCVWLWGYHRQPIHSKYSVILSHSSFHFVSLRLSLWRIYKWLEIIGAFLPFHGLAAFCFIFVNLSPKVYQAWKLLSTNFFQSGDKLWSTVDCCPSQIHQKFERRQYLCKEKYTKSFFLLDWPARIFSHLFFTNLILTQFLFAQSELKPKCRKQITSSEIHKFFRKKWLRSALFLVNKNYDDTRKKTDNHVNSLGWSSYFWMYTT